MKKLVFLFLFLPLFLLADVAERPFTKVVPSFNNKEWYQKNLDSIFNQKYNNYRVIYIADAPSDGTTELVEEYVQKNQQQHRFLLLKNKEYSGYLCCMCQAAHLCDKNEIIIDLNGNDWLAHADVLSYLNEVYSNPDVWMTYGQFTYYPDIKIGFAQQIPSDLIENNSFRTSLSGHITHLRTFYAGLFQKIEKEDFLWQSNFIPKAGDLAYMFPLCEMAGKHAKFLSQTLYIYNRSSPLNEHKASNNLEQNLDNFIRGKKKYSPLAEQPTMYSQIDSSDEHPQVNIIPVNAERNEKENCIVVYASFTENEPKLLARLIKLICQSDFKGHILYHLGGWPDGAPTLTHVPSAHRIAAIKEAQNLGYKRVLWLDPATIPLVSLNDIFASIQEKGYFIFDKKQKGGAQINRAAAAYFGLTLRLTLGMPSCSTNYIGLDLTQATGRKITDWWFRAAHDKDAFYTPQADQNALSMILYKLGISDYISTSRSVLKKEEIKSDSLFWLDKECSQE